MIFIYFINAIKPHKYYIFALSLISSHYFIKIIFLTLLFIFYHTLGRKIESKEAIRTETEYFLLMLRRLFWTFYANSPDEQAQTMLRKFKLCSHQLQNNSMFLCALPVFQFYFSHSVYEKNKLLGSRTAYAGRLSFRLSRKL